MSRGKAKGSAFERKIAKEIVKAFRAFGITQKDCWRSTLSGGHARAAGDLELSERLAKLFPFCLEMKHRKKIRFENLFMKKSTEENGWIRQTCAGADKFPGSTPVLVMRANNCPIYALVGPRSEVHVLAPEIYFLEEGLTGVEGPWQLMLWQRFLTMAVQLAKDLDRR